MSDITRSRPRAYWESKNPVLYNGEFGFEDETGRVKKGDGTKRWSQLSFLDIPPWTIEWPSVDLGGGVKKVAGKTPDAQGNVNLTASDVPSGTFGDNQIPASVARDSEVSSAVAAAVAALVDSSPAALDTLKELASALGNDANFATTVNTALSLRAVTIVHGSTAGMARPATPGPVVWYGTVTPTNLADGDVFVLVSSS